MDKVILIGAGGHCKGVLDLLLGQYEVYGLIDSDTSKHGSTFYGKQVLGGDNELTKLYAAGIINAIISVGSVGNSGLRKRLYFDTIKLGYNMINAISKSAIISPTAKMGNGNTVLDRVVIHSDTLAGNNIIFNTACIVEHDCIIGDHVHIAPGAVISGEVRIGEGSHIGTGASIIQGIIIGRNCIVGAGAAVTKNIPDNCLCVGVPAKVIRHIPGEVGNEG